MKHYICTGGCDGVSDKPGTCQALACPKNGEPLIECNCTDGKHGHSSAAPATPEVHPEEK